MESVTSKLLKKAKMMNRSNKYRMSDTQHTVIFSTEKDAHFKDFHILSPSRVQTDSSWGFNP